MSEQYASADADADGLAERLRDRIYDEVVPRLAGALVDAQGLSEPTRDELDATYRATLVLCYRLLFLAHAEARGHLPRGRNSTYDRYSLGGIASELAAGTTFGRRPTLWERVQTLTRGVHEGAPEMGVPAYGGRLLSADPEVNEAGARLARVELSDAAFGPALEGLLVDDPPEGRATPVDFGAVDVRELGVVHERLLESDLSVADTDLTTEPRRGDEQYVPADADDPVVVEAGEVYLHGHSGERKATGAYYTPPRFVEHLLEYSLDPALEAHLDRVDRVRERDGETAASDALFEFAVADVAMGSGHFLLGAVEHVTAAFRAYLRANPLPGVERELDDLAARAETALANAAAETNAEAVSRSEVDRRRLLRRAVASRCLYGVDLDGLAAELARLSLWVDTFVPGLPLDDFASTLRTGDSLAGVGTLDEVPDTLRVDDPVHHRDDLAATRARFDVLAAARVDDDIDPSAVDSTVPDPRDTPTYEAAEAALGSTDPLHFPVAFPEVFGDGGGFDVVVGNPPWEEAVLEADEFWARYVPGLRGRSQGDQERLKTRLRAERPDLVAEFERERATQERRRRTLANGPYPGMGTGDPDTYKAFCWRFWDLLRDGGYLGVVLPRSALVAAGSASFRRTLLTEGTVTDATLLENTSGWVFDGVAEQYTVALLAARKSPPGPDDTLPLRGPFTDAESYERGLDAGPYRFDPERALHWTGTASFPRLPDDPRSVAAFAQQARHPPLGLDDPDTWRARPHTELHATGDKTAADGSRVMTFPEDPPVDHWPVYRGGSFTHWVPDTGERYAWIAPEVARAYLQEQRENSYRYAGSRSAFSEMDESWVHDPETLPCLAPRVAFRDIARSSDPRTIVSALVPPETVLTNKAPYFLWPRGDERDEAYLLGVTSSIPFDWYARRFVELGVNYHILNALPVPRPGRGAPLRRRVVELAGRLAAVDDRYAEWATAVGVDCGPLDDTTRRESVHELDAVVAHLYGLSREHLEVVFDTFREDDSLAERRDAVLGWYDEWCDAGRAVDE
ncbi:hypothetical protein N0B31_08305 [Salinirubellus salinus]|uniref:site-specific DNA-methyltransferase (adenine-specific) n=1 Tax=Salinirubellus salinus TaxID=1364945 RepID=A0A9E7R5I3_9EURY|nr:hypothetical protein [Salinirubellus salinus]UWM56285.1 hypothetical protein N0B31_08305 [Salinirubellus salinus]